MYVITGITGQVGGVVAQTLLDQGDAVRAVVRSAAKGAPWQARGCDVAIAEVADADALTRAFTDAQGVFVLLPPHFDPSPDFAESRANIAGVVKALQTARPARVVCLSTVGAQATQPSLLSQLSLLEQHLGALDLPVTFLRAAWFMENAAWDVARARTDGVLESYLSPLDRAIPMVATADVGTTAAQLLREPWEGKRVVELCGPEPVSPALLAQALGRELGRDVVAHVIARDEWEARFLAQGMRYPTPRMQMLDGFNEGWMTFEGTPRRGTTPLADVVKALVACQ
ncbi:MULTISPECIES: NAD(P)H-binding protein [Pandoraea]|uniref:NAD(P)H-binding protein n=1 Tax=Pandoraea TaxID=93217 RepID=UPI001F5C0C81|nr:MULTISPECIES: NAD(P)H-binding protein [Pandoraea]MCI3207843.1 NmrA family transcriptional regulator [Pandoraea sp. LA3]MDN4585872.1 NmrA family transcriptional regulator [Pandoraea capi]